jgi:predicted membrane protein
MEVEKRNNWHSFNNLIIALIFIAVGFVLIGRNIGLIAYPISRVIISWQMLLIVIGLVSLLRNHGTGGAILVAIGAFFMVPLLPGMGYFEVSRFWPLIFVLVGLIIIFRRRDYPKYWHRHHRWDNFQESTSYTTEDGFVNSTCSFGSVIRVVTDPVFKGARISNSFGSTMLDLRRTSLADGETYIDVDCSFGGIEIYVPDSWNVKTFVKNSFSGTADKRYHLGVADTAKTLIIRGNISFSGLEIKG